MRQIVSVACGIWLALATALTAQEQDVVVVVELFTSQGCSACPPADELLGRLVQDPRIIPLALHVDYWDYLGWKDTFGNAKFTERQKAYARAEGTKMVYTPQMIVAGFDRVAGHRPADVEAAIVRQRANGGTVRLSLERRGTRLMIRAEQVLPSDRSLRVQLVRYLPSEDVEIRRGENAGRTITYHNIVTSWQVIG
ncbi:MAG: DUF1223 domain-containing protein, partial [Paracoccaceae bacterium]|nr:DUF1223 domain-containing protein [Paracoccaceae bacterium]